MPIVASTSVLDEKVKASSTDTVAGNLTQKLSAGSGITISKLNTGGNEQLEISTGGSSIAEVVIATGASELLDTSALVDMCAKSYKLCMFSLSEDRWKSLMVCGSKVTSSSVEHNVSSILGDKTLNVDIDFRVDAANAVLEATNNEAFPITVKYRLETI